MASWGQLKAFRSWERGELTGDSGKPLQEDPQGKNLSRNDRWCEDNVRLSDTFMILSFSLAHVPPERAPGLKGRPALKSIDRAK